MLTHEPGFLIALRAKTGLTQSVVALNAGCARTTVVRWELTGKIQDKHFAILEQLSKDVVRPVTAGLPHAGRPQKTYKLRPPRNDRDERLLDLRFFLWLPGHPDDRWEIWTPPVGEGDSWLEQHQNDPNNGKAGKIWFRWERGANMSERIVSVLLGPSRSQAVEQPAILWEHLTRNPRHFTNYERPDNWETLIRATAEKDGYAMPDLSLVKQITKP